MSGTLLALLGAVGFPALAFILNWQFRAQKGYALSAAADFVLALIVFDLGAAAGHEIFSTLAPSEVLRHDFALVFLLFFTLSLISWLLYFVRNEQKLAEGYSYRTHKYKAGPPMKDFLITWSVVGGLLAPHILTFFLR